MLRVGGRPLLDIWLDAFHQAGVDEVLVNVHYLPDVVERHLEQRIGPPIVHTVFEPALLGSAGTLLANREWVKGEDFFLACYADNLTDFDLRSLVDFHRQGSAPASLSVFRAENPAACGIVELDSAHCVVSFVEKPSAPASNLANAGMYAFVPGVLDEVAGDPPKDIGYDLLPLLVGRARALLVDGYLQDIGTPETYQSAQRKWQEKAVR
jgi:mannose-1-phosphate guanylyltransferase